MTANNGMWVVASTLQGGGTIDEIDGPFWTEAEAEAWAKKQREKFHWRHDLFQVYLLTGDYS
jgi:hypothetical protein